VAVALIVTVALVVGRDDPWERTGPPLAVSGWAPYWQVGEALESFAGHAELFGDVSLAGWSVREDGTVQPYDVELVALNGTTTVFAHHPP